MSYIIQLSSLFIILILFHYINIYYYFQINKYFNKSTEVYNISINLIKTNELLWQNTQVINILIFIAFSICFDYYNNPPDIICNINNWICLVIILLEYKNICFVNDFLNNRNKI